MKIMSLPRLVPIPGCWEGGGAGTSGDNHKRKLMGGVCKEGVESRHDQDVDT